MEYILIALTTLFLLSLLMYFFEYWKNEGRFSVIGVISGLGAVTVIGIIAYLILPGYIGK